MLLILYDVEIEKSFCCKKKYMLYFVYCLSLGYFIMLKKLIYELNSKNKKVV